MKKLYISGKITGDPDYKEKFEKVRKESEDNYIVLNPAVLPEGMLPADYIRVCFAMIDAADVVLFLPDYKESKGAMLEWDYCRYIGKKRFVAFWKDCEASPGYDEFEKLYADGIKAFVCESANQKASNDEIYIAKLGDDGKKIFQEDCVKLEKAIAEGDK